LTLTQTWNTANTLETKIEMADNLAKGLKAEGVFSFLPATQARGAKFNLHFKQPNFHGRAFFDLLKGPTASLDAIVGHEGFLAGASAGYDVQKAKITGYSAAVGYQALTYSAAITATDNLSVFAASYYHKVNSQVEAGSKATWNSKSGNAVGLEVAAKYRLDPVSFVKVRSSFFLAGPHTQSSILTRYKNRPRSTTAVLPPSPTTCSSARASPSASALPLIPRSSTRPPTRLVPLLSSQMIPTGVLIRLV
jgi:voltage-dependent anion channel protein 2